MQLIHVEVGVKFRTLLAHDITNGYFMRFIEKIRIHTLIQVHLRILILHYFGY